MPDTEVKDPVGLRDPMRCVQDIEDLLRDKAAVGKPDTKLLRVLLAKLLDSLDSLDLAFEVQGDSDRLACQLLSIGQAFARGEASELDEDGFLKLGDTATELADQLYAYATEE